MNNLVNLKKKIILCALFLFYLNPIVINTYGQNNENKGIKFNAEALPNKVNVKKLKKTTEFPKLDKRVKIPLRVPDKERLKLKKNQLEKEKPLSEIGKNLSGPVFSELLPGTLAASIMNNFDGLDFGDNPFALSPPDPTVAAGPNHILEMVNLVGRIWDKQGNFIIDFSLDSFFALPAGYSGSDPQVIYDVIGGRWFASFFAYSFFDSLLIIAVSETNDPTGNWTVYQASHSDCTDFPHLGVSDDKVILTYNSFNSCFNSNAPFKGAAYYVLNKSQLMNGDTSVDGVFFEPDSNFFTIQPATSLTTTNAHYMASSNQESNKLTVFKVTGIPGVSSVDVTTTSLNILQKAIPPNAEQLNTSTRIVTNDDRLLGAVWRNDKLWVSATVACTPAGDTVSRSCLRLIEVLTSGTPSINQDFNYGISGYYYYFPAVITDNSGNLHVVFSRSSSSEYANVRVSGRLSSDALNTLQSSTLVQAGLATHLSDRWGDYFAGSVDPADTSKVWVVGEYAKSSSSGSWYWGTSIAQLSFTTTTTSTTLSTSSTSTTTTTTTTSTTTTTVLDSCYGDVSGNLAISSYDAALIAQYSVGLLTDFPVCVGDPAKCLLIGDVSGNLAISSYDAALIAQYSVGLITTFPVGTPVCPSQLLSMTKASLQATGPTVTVSQVEGNPGDIVEVDISTDNALPQVYPVNLSALEINEEEIEANVIYGSVMVLNSAEIPEISSLSKSRGWYGDEVVINGNGRVRLCSYILVP